MDTPASTALITGGSRGIGRACAAALARKGLSVILTYVSNGDEAAAAADAIRADGGSARALPLDVADAAAVADFFASTIKGKADLAVLVNNAGIVRNGLIARMGDEDFDMVLSVDLRGAFLCMREAAKLMMRRRGGRIVNISSVVGQFGAPGQANYAAAKAGLIGLTKAAAKELAGRNITVNAVAPGYVDTDMTRSLSDDVRAGILGMVPLKRIGTPEDVAHAVAFLASEEAGYITGQVLAVNGGLYC